MARPLRIEHPGAYYHVINRGNNLGQRKIPPISGESQRNDYGEYIGRISGTLITMMHNRVADESKKVNC